MNDPKITDVDEATPATDKLNDLEELPSLSDLLDLPEQIRSSAIKARMKEYEHWGDSAPPPEDELRPKVEEWYDENYGDLPTRWQFFTERSVYMPASLASAYQSAKDDISAAQLSEINTVISAVNHWAGLAKVSFQTNFLNPMVNQTVSCQQLLFDELTVAANAYEGVLRTLQIDSYKLGKAVVKVLDSLADCTKDDVSESLAVCGVAVGILATVASGGAALPLTLGLIGGGISAAETALSGDDESADITQDTAEAVMGELYNEIDRLMDYAEAEESAIAGGLNTTLGEVNSYLNSTEPLTKATLLPHEPTGDGVPNLTNGKVPPFPDFHPHD